MKTNALAWPVVAALALAGLGSNAGAAAVDEAAKITIPGTIASSGGDKLILRTDDHGHLMPFEIGSAASLPGDLRKGAHVSVTYHPLGPTGQAADEVRMIDRGALARSQASFLVVTGPSGVRLGAR